MQIALQLVRQGELNGSVSKGVELVESTEGKAQSCDESAEHISKTDSSSSSSDSESSSDDEAAETNSKDEVTKSEVKLTLFTIHRITVQIRNWK